MLARRTQLVITEVNDEVSNKIQQQYLQRDIENASRNIAALSIEAQTSEEGEACASASTSLRPDKDHMLCRICYNGTRDILFMSCNHIVTCSICADKITVCPVCRTLITSKFQVRYK